MPGLTGTSVYRKGTYVSSGKERAFPLTIRDVTVLSKPYGEPMATTHSPTFTLLESPSLAVGRFRASIHVGVGEDHAVATDDETGAQSAHGNIARLHRCLKVPGELPERIVLRQARKLRRGMDRSM